MTGATPVSRQEETALTVSVYALLAPLVERFARIALMAGVGAVFGLAFGIMARPRYAAEATFTPQAPPSTQLGGLAGLTGLASQLNLGVASSGNSSPDFYASLLKSRELLALTLRSSFTSPDGSRRATPLLQLMEVRPVAGNDTLAEGVRRLDKLTSVSVDRTTSIVRLAVSLYDRQLAADVANRMVELLNQFNLDRRQSQSREQARFARERATTAEGEMREAESALLRFLMTNRTYRGSPLLENEVERLQRQVTLKQEVYITLVKSYEESRIAQVRDTPLLTVLDHAVPPDRRSFPRKILLVLLGLTVGLAVGVVAAYLPEIRASEATQSHSPDAERFFKAWHAFPRSLGLVRGRSMQAR